MANFSYVAVASDGKEKKGTMEAANEDAVVSALRNQGLIATSVTTASALNKEFNIGGKVKAKDLQLFCTQFESIMHAGVTIIQCMDMMVDQTTNKKLKNACAECKLLIEKGDTLATAMAQFPDVFPEMLVNMIEAGEQSGSLEIAFHRMAIQFEKDAKMSSMIVSAMIYPIVLLVVIIAVVVLMLVKIVPQFQETFDSAGAKLPALTVAVVAMSNALIHNWYWIVGIVVAIVIAFRTWSHTETGAVTLGRLLLKLPLFGDLVLKNACAKLARTLSTLTSSGIPLVTAIEMCGKIMSNIIIKRVIQDAKSDVEKGVPLSQPLEASGVFPPLLYQMCKIGEETGNLEDMLDHCADFYEDEVETATQNIATVVEPLIIIVMAAIVAPILGAVMMPMLSIYSVAENA